jgi:plastocyanin
MNHRAPACVSSVMRRSTRPHVRRSLLALATATLLVAGAAACGSDDNTSTSSGNDATTTSVDSSGGRYGSGDTSGGSGESTDGTIMAKDFSLTDLTVGPGEKFTMKNEGPATHTATADDGAFDSGQVTAGSSSSEMTAPMEPGSYPFHCQIHATMTATLTVEG